ncbi:MAG: histidine kinase dimerization/phospho-acceptor domain-containing protein, partial [Pseudomonadota bacterium]
MVTVKKGSRLEQEVIRRVTAERRLKAALVALKAARERAADAHEDDTGRDDMLAAINHQMRGPLASVTNAFSLLGDSVLTPEQADWVSAGRHGARALLYQLNQLRELGHLELHGIELDEAEAAVADLLDDVVDLFSTQIQSERLELYAQLAPGAGARILCDIGRIRQILINLVSMGLAARRGDRILLSADLIDEELHLRVEVPASAPTVASIVRRPGARGDDAPVTVEAGELGLTITRRLVALLGGHLSIDGTSRGDFQVAVRIPWKLARQPRDRHVAKLLDAAREADVALIVPGRHRDLLLEETFRRWGVTFHRYERARSIVQARQQPTLVVAQGDATNMLRVTARGGIRSV